MAKDGTRRGGARPGAGRKKKSAKPEQPENVLQFTDVTEDERESFPKFNHLLYDAEGKFSLAEAESIYYSVYRYAKKNNAADKLPREIVESFAVAYTRWVQVEREITQKGFIAAHPTTGGECKSPLVEVSNTYSKNKQNDWYAIWSIIKDGCTDGDGDDPMEALLSGAGADGV